MSAAETLEEQELRRPIGGVKCLHCADWGCRRCLPQPDAGEQGLSVEEKELIALRNRVRELTVALEGLSRRVEDMARESGWRPDHACVECVPWSDCLVRGFECGRHMALRLLKEDGRG